MFLKFTPACMIPYEHIHDAVLLFSLILQVFSCCREELEKHKSHARYMRLQEEGKTDQARQDLGEA